MKNILIVRPDSIGDWVIFTSILPQLKSMYPDHAFHLVIQDRITELAELHFPKKNIHAFADKKTLLHDRAALTQYIGHLNALRFDLLIYPVFSRCILGDLLCRSIKAGRKITFKGDASNQLPEMLASGSTAYDLLVKVPETVSTEVDRYPYLLKALGSRTRKKVHPHLDVPPAIVSKMKRKIAHEIGDRPFLVLSPFPQLPIRNWPLEKWIDLVKELNAYGLIVTGSESQSKISRQLIRKSRHPLIVNWCGQTDLIELCALIQLAELHIGVESSASQIAPAVNTHTVVILGGGHFGRFVPYSRYHHAVFRKLSCYHCNWHCPYKAPYCITDIPLADVLGELKKCGITLEKVRVNRVDGLPFKYYQYGSLHKALKHTETSIQYFDKVLECKLNRKTKGGACFHLGELHLEQGNEALALNYFQKCLKRIPNHEQARKHFERLSFFNGTSLQTPNP